MKLLWLDGSIRGADSQAKMGVLFPIMGLVVTESSVGRSESQTDKDNLEAVSTAIDWIKSREHEFGRTGDDLCYFHKAKKVTVTDFARSWDVIKEIFDVVGEMKSLSIIVPHHKNFVFDPNDPLWDPILHRDEVGWNVQIFKATSTKFPLREGVKTPLGAEQHLLNNSREIEEDIINWRRGFAPPKPKRKSRSVWAFDR